MTNATFLLAFNFSIGLSFAIAFVALARGSDVPLARWCAAGFLSAAATVCVEAFAPVLPDARLTSSLSFGFLLAALTLIGIGLARHTGAKVPTAWLAAACVSAMAFNSLVVFDLPRGGWAQALGYQGPFAAASGATAVVFARRSRGRAVDIAVVAILALSTIQFMAKIVLSGLSRHGPNVRDYIVSPYAFYSQTAGGILSLLLGLSLLALLATEVVEQTKHRLQSDSLSGLLNRAAFMEQVQAFVRKARAPIPTILILADLDRFKAINDCYGHAAGDEVIRTFGAHLRTHFGDRAIYGRLGGEEFCILVPESTAADIRRDLDAIRSLGRQARYALLPNDITVTASFGVAITDLIEPFEAALHRADVALYQVKQAGRDHYRFATADDDLEPGDPFRLRANAAG